MSFLTVKRSVRRGRDDDDDETLNEAGFVYAATVIRMFKQEWPHMTLPVTRVYKTRKVKLELAERKKGESKGKMAKKRVKDGWQETQ